MFKSSDTFMNVSQYFQDPGAARRVLVDEFKLFTAAEADALLNSRLNVGQVSNSGGPSFPQPVLLRTQGG